LDKVEKDKSARNFKEEMNRYIKKAHLDQFFRKEKEGFLDEVIKKAVELEADPKSSAHPSDLIRLALFQPVLYCGMSTLQLLSRLKKQNHDSD
jgi:hypothetical protein